MRQNQSGTLHHILKGTIQKADDNPDSAIVDPSS